ncbi:MAG: hypothetical protein ACLFTK_02065 [Anaerolineales bacterium]
MAQRVSSQDLWPHIFRAYAPDPTERATIQALLAEYHQFGVLRRTPSAMMRLSDAVIAGFYAGLAAEKPAQSPVAEHPHAHWMARADICFINVRAAGTNGTLGTFITAAKLLPGLRVDAIHLAPFLSYEFGGVYAIRAARTIARQLVDPFLLEYGVDAEAHLQAFVAAAHLLGLAVGFDLEPHFTQFARPVLMHPEHFRWMKLYPPDKRWLDYYWSMEDTLQAPNQQQLAGEVRAIVQAELHKHAIRDLEYQRTDSRVMGQLKMRVYQHLVRTLIDQGYWTIPSHVWVGVGIPEYKEYNHDDNYPDFDYRGAEGEDLRHLAFGIVTPIQFYYTLKPNRMNEAPPRINHEAIDYYADLFTFWRDTFDFDFVRHDYVDHVFDSIINRDYHMPASDRPTPYVLRRAIERSRQPDKPYIGHLAEYMGTEFAREYAALGYDLILGEDMLTYIDAEHMRDSFALYDDLLRINLGRGAPFSVSYALDTHDTGNPGLWESSIIQHVGARGIQLRQFIARFIGAGLTQRPKYEVMGLQDMSYGLFQANIGEATLTWADDTVHHAIYHHIEDVYTAQQPFLKRAHKLHHHVADTFAWWVLHDGHARWLVAVVGLEYAGASGEPPGVINIDLSKWLITGATLRYDFSTTAGAPYDLSASRISISDLPYQGYVLFEINGESA